MVRGARALVRAQSRPTNKHHSSHARRAGLSKRAAGFHRLHFMMQDGSSKITLYEAWNQLAQSCICCFVKCGSVEAVNSKYRLTSDRESALHINVMTVNGALYSARAESRDTAKAIKEWTYSHEVGACCCFKISCAKCYECWKMCWWLACCGCCKCPCPALPVCCAIKCDSVAGLFTKSAQYTAQLEDMLGVMEESENLAEAQQFDVKVAEPWVGQSKQASLAKNVRAIHLVYRDPSTNTTQTCCIIVDPKEPIERVIEFVSYIETLCAPPQGIELKTAHNADMQHPEPQRISRLGI